MNSDNEFRSFIENTLIILVLYKADLHNTKSFKSLTDIINSTDAKVKFFVYDNSPDPSYIDSEAINENIYYVSDRSNPGIGKAYNEGCKYAQQADKKWLLLADQDTIFPADLFREYYDSLIKHPEIHLYVPKLMQHNFLLSPCRYTGHVGRALRHIASGVHSFANRTVLNSGMLVSADSFSKAGGFNEKIKLDFADFFFINQYKKLYPDFFVTNSICTHELSYFDNDVDKTLVRFRIYCSDGRTYADNPAAFITVGYFVFRRTFKLTFKYKRNSFVKIFLTDFLFCK